MFGTKKRQIATLEVVVRTLTRDVRSLEQSRTRMLKKHTDLATAHERLLEFLNLQEHVIAPTGAVIVITEEPVQKKRSKK